ncbi:MAG: hypothetical protein HOO86_12275 [Bacteroidales bacterium]|nr:hypothetical protein [Bacteroidales bacterium]
MKKALYLLLFVATATVAISSCKKDNGGDDPIVVVASPIKTMGVVYPDGVERYDFTYDATSKKISKIEDYWNDELDKTLVYDYSVAGKLTITGGSDPIVYDLNAAGYVSKDVWSTDEWAAYEYNTDGYLIKVTEHWGGADHLKNEIEIVNGNVVKQTTYDDDGVTVKKIKTFTYTTGDNVNDIHQTSMIDSNTKPIGNLFGKPSKKLNDYLEYWDPREEPIEKSRTTITYEFDTKNRPSMITRVGVDWQEVYTYTYVE